jgi:hypothetical protein
MCTGASCTADQPGDYTVTGLVVQTNARATALLRVMPLPVITGPTAATPTSAPTPPATDRIVRVVLDPVVASIGLGATQAYTARAFDAGGSDRGDVTARTTFSIQPTGSCVRGRCTAGAAGVYRVTGSLPGSEADGAAELRVTAAPLAQVVLDPAVGSVGVGGSQAYRVLGLDTAGAFLGEVTDRVVFSISPSGSCAANACSAARPGKHRVTAAVLGTGIVGAAMLRVTPAPLVQITLDPAVGSVVPKASQAYRTRGFDTLGNELGDVTARTAFTIEPAGSCSVASCTVMAAGDYTVTGSVVGTRVSATAPLRAVSLEPVRTVRRLPTEGLAWVLVLGGAFLLFTGGSVFAGAAVGGSRGARPAEPPPPNSSDGQRDDDWVRENVRVESRPGEVRTAVREDPRTTTFAVRLEPHGDPTGKQTVEEARHGDGPVA